MNQQCGLLVFKLLCLLKVVIFFKQNLLNYYCRYGPDAPELQVRKLGDLAFMFQLYEVAYQAYHNAKRDFSADQAWLHFAGASVCTFFICF